MTRAGLRAIGIEEGLELFDVALGGVQPAVLAAPIDRHALRGLVQEGSLPALLSGLVSVPQRRTGKLTQRGSLAQRLAETLESERPGIILELVRAQAAIVLGHAGSSTIDPNRPFKDLGFDSLGAVELRNRLSTHTGLRLPASLVFDHPTPKALAGYFLAELTGTAPLSRRDGDEAEIAAVIASISVDRLRAAGLLNPLLSLARHELSESVRVAQEGVEAIDAMDLDTLLQTAMQGAEETA
jgi:acyl carrier protein